MSDGAERWRRLEEVCQAALERPAHERAAFLAEACGADAGLRREAASLLEREARADGFLATPLGELAANAMTYSPGGTPCPDESRDFIGRRIGTYEIRAQLGAGGMGEVYRAHDHTLGREVAIKVLPAAFSADRERLARFEREARLLASLSHPHIGAIYGLEGSDDVRALVLELIDGETLETRLGRGPLPAAQALTLAVQIAEAVDHAHRKGVTHRDLKPANVMLTKAGAKLLDFGLAKWSRGPSGYVNLSAPSMKPDGVDSLTEEGAILGTPHYMAPEQLEGKEVDARADVFAFGAVLYEMLTGRKAFDGGSAAAVMAAVLNAEPTPLDAIESRVPRSLERLIRKCLAKDPDQRWQTARDLADELRWIAEDALRPPSLQGPSDDSAGEASPRSGPLQIDWRIGTVLAFLTAAIAGGLVWNLRSSPASSPSATEMRVDIQTPPTTDPASIAISADGQMIAFVALHSGRRPLWVRSLDSDSARALPDTDGASYPFWDPQNRSIGFFADDGTLKRVDLDGGTVRVLASSPMRWGGTWNTDGTILFAPLTGPILRVSASGGEPTSVTTLQPQQTNHSFPRWLPDGRHFLYYVRGTPEVRGVYIAAIDRPEGRRLVDADSTGVSLSRDHLLFVRGTTVFAQKFDLVAMQLSGSPFAVIRSVELGVTAALSSSATGSIAYRTATAPPQRQFVWFDRAGRVLSRVGDPDGGSPLSPSLSPDGGRLAFHRHVAGNLDIWSLDTRRGVLTRLTTNVANEIHPIWAADGDRILFNSNRNGSYELYEKAATPAGAEKLLLRAQAATDWSRDGRFLLMQRRDPQKSTDIWAMPIGSSDDAFPVVHSEFEERDGQFSPDGKWVAYASTESGGWEIYVEPFPGSGPKVRLSTAGGAQPRWRADGKELFYIAIDDRLMAVPIALRPAGKIEAGAPVALFATRVGGAIQAASRTQYFASADGAGFLMNTVLDETTTSPITLILNWSPGQRRQGQ